MIIIVTTIMIGGVILYRLICTDDYARRRSKDRKEWYRCIFPTKPYEVYTKDKRNLRPTDHNDERISLIDDPEQTTYNELLDVEKQSEKLMTSSAERPGPRSKLVHLYHHWFREREDEGIRGNKTPPHAEEGSFRSGHHLQLRLKHRMLRSVGSGET
jgi:hypothetical protein